MPKSRHESNVIVRIAIVLGIVVVCTTSSWSLAEEMLYPLAVAVNAEKTIFVADRDLPGIWKIVDGKPTIHVQGSKKFRTPLNAVRCLAIDSKGVLYAGDSSTREVYRIEKDGTPHPLTKGGIGIPMAMAIDPQGDLLVADLERHVLFSVPNQGGQATELGRVPAPRGVAIDSQDRIWMISHSKNPIVRFRKDRTLENVLSENVFQFAHQLVVDGQGNCYVTDGYAKAIWKIPADGKPEKWISGDPFKNPVGLAIDGDRLLIADPHQKKIFSVFLSGDGSIESIIK